MVSEAPLQTQIERELEPELKVTFTPAPATQMLAPAGMAIVPELVTIVAPDGQTVCALASKENPNNNNIHTIKIQIFINGCWKRSICMSNPSLPNAKMAWISELLDEAVHVSYFY